MTGSLIDSLGRTILVGSGAMGTSLRRGETDSTGPIELANLKNPKNVVELHKAYRDAGSQILITNTFAANPLAMHEEGLAGLCREINEAGVSIARTVAGKDCMVWGSVGPLALGLRLDDFSPERLAEIYGKQCSALAGADALLLETFTEAREAAAAIKAAAGTGLPVIFQIGNTGGGRDRWDRIELLLAIATRAGVAAVGTNCRHPNEILEVAEYLAGRTSLPVTASPNAGHPRLDRGLVTYEFSPEDFARVAEKLAATGVAVIGGCCGTTPEHIRRVSKAITGKPVTTRTMITTAGLRSTVKETPKAGKNRVRSVITSQKLVISVEIRANRKQSLKQILAGASEIAEAGADMFDVPDNPGATVGRDAMVVASKLQETLGVPSICHKAVIQSNMLQHHSSLIGCWDLGLQGLLTITGDAPSMGHLGGMAKMVSDLKSSVELLRLVRNMREGRMINNEEIADPPDFCAGCGFGSPTPPQINWLKKKIEAGAEFVFTQPIFTIDDFRTLRDSLAGLPVRIFPGIMPLTGRKNAEFLADGKIPGIKVPLAVLDAFRQIESETEQRAFGLKMAAELATAVALEGSSVYLIMPFGKNAYAETAQLVRTIRKNGAEGRSQSA